MPDPHDAAPRAPTLLVEHAADRDVYSVRHARTGAWVEVPGKAVREQLRRAGVAPSWPEERRAAIAVARGFLKQGINRESLSRRLNGSGHSDPR